MLGAQTWTHPRGFKLHGFKTHPHGFEPHSCNQSSQLLCFLFPHLRSEAGDGVRPQPVCRPPAVHASGAGVSSQAWVFSGLTHTHRNSRASLSPSLTNTNLTSSPIGGGSSTSKSSPARCTYLGRVPSWVLSAGAKEPWHLPWTCLHTPVPAREGGVQRAADLRNGG